MKIRHVIIVILLLAVIYLIFRKKPSSTLPPPSLVITNGTGTIPPTWNFDWQGGPGKDRHDIMAEKGPYNPEGVVYAVM